MLKCPYCNSSTVRKYDWDIDFYGDDEIVIHRDYVCKSCGEYFRTDKTYRTDSEEIVREEDE